MSEVKYWQLWPLTSPDLAHKFSWLLQNSAQGYYIWHVSRGETYWQIFICIMTFSCLYNRSMITNFFEHMAIQSDYSISLAEMLQLMQREQFRCMGSHCLQGHFNVIWFIQKRRQCYKCSQILWTDVSLFTHIVCFTQHVYLNLPHQPEVPTQLHCSWWV
jgi:hypothetical protein